MRALMTVLVLFLAPGTAGAGYDPDWMQTAMAKQAKAQLALQKAAGDLAGAQTDLGPTALGSMCGGKQLGGIADTAHVFSDTPGLDDVQPYGTSVRGMLQPSLEGINKIGTAMERGPAVVKGEILDALPIDLGATCDLIAQAQAVCECADVQLPNLSLGALAGGGMGLPGIPPDILSASGLECAGVDYGALEAEVSGLVQPMETHAAALYGDCGQARSVPTPWTAGSPDFRAGVPGPPQDVVASSNPDCPS